MQRIRPALAGLVALAAMPAAHAAPINVLVPAYGNPCCAGGAPMWASLIATTADPNRRFELDVIFNPASGPGTAREPNYLSATGTGPLADLRAAGGVAFGYVATGYGTRALADIKADVNAYFTGHYAGYVQGIFFDEMSNDLGKVGYYRELQDYVKTLRPGARTVGNPGSTFVNNPSAQTAFTAADYLGALDTLVTFESSSTAYATGYVGQPYLSGAPASKIAHMVHTHAQWNGSLLDTAAARGAGYLFVTDDVMDNPYDMLPSYWPQFTADVSAHNLAAVPEPSSAALLLAALGVLAWRVRCAAPVGV